MEGNPGTDNEVERENEATILSRNIQGKSAPMSLNPNDSHLLDIPVININPSPSLEANATSSQHSPRTNSKQGMLKNPTKRSSRSASFTSAETTAFSTHSGVPMHTMPSSSHGNDPSAKPGTVAPERSSTQSSRSALRDSQLRQSPRPTARLDHFLDTQSDLEMLSSSPSLRPLSPLRSHSSSSTYTRRHNSNFNKSKSQLNLMTMTPSLSTSMPLSAGANKTPPTLPATRRRGTISHSPNHTSRNAPNTPNNKTNNSPNNTSSINSGSRNANSSFTNVANTMTGKGYRYYAQEKAYLKKIQHDTNDEYISKPLGSTLSISDVDSDSDDDLDILPREAVGLGGVGTSFDDEYTDNVTTYPFLEASYNHEEMENDESLPERLEWQAMLASVLTGEVVRSEKRRLKTTSDVTMKEDDLWLEIRARMCGRTFEAQKRAIEYSRANVEATLQEIKEFHIADSSDLKFILEQVNKTLLKLEYCEQLWQSTQLMKSASPLYRDPLFQRHVEALTTWSTITEWISREIHLLQLWTANEAADPTIPPDSCNQTPMIEASSLVERVLKQEDLMKVFNEKIKSNIGPVIERAREGHLHFREEFNRIGLPVYVEGLEKLMKFPIKLIQEIISLRLLYAKRMTNPTMMLADQMIEDLSLYMNIALLVKERNLEYTLPVPDIQWITYSPDSLFDKTLLECVIFLFQLISSKFIDTSFTQVHRGFKEIDNFESQYYFLEQVGRHVKGGEIVVAIQSCSLVMKMNSRLLSYWEYQTKGPPAYTKIEVERWYTHTTERIRKAQRKLLRFYKILSSSYENAIEFSVQASRLKSFMKLLKKSNHFLVYTGALEKDGVYCIADSSLMNNPDKIRALINGYSSRSLSNPNIPVQYLLIVCIQEPLVWEGPIVNLDVKYIDMDIKPGRMRLVCEGGTSDLIEARERLTSHSGSMDFFEVAVESISQLPRVNHELARMRKLLYRISMSVIADTCKFRKTFEGHQETVHNFFAFAREFGQRGINVMDESRRGHLAINLINLCIEWLSFICDSCVPTDIKTFRWTVVAIEFTMIMTRGVNIVALSDEQFTKLRLKVAGCMTLLISHFDIMGARSTAERRQRMTRDKELNKQRTIKDDVELIKEFHCEVAKKLEQMEEKLRSNQNMGKVLDEHDTNTDLVTYLASNFSKVSIRWQQGRFIGSGSFGTVYAAVNMDTGSVMAVKEIKMQDSQSMKQVLKATRDEMTVLEMLHHPNIVHYYGVEVHRDRVFIFMEYCQGGSLARLLEYGRIEDEKVIQVYAMQMLEGLAYLHHMGVVHRDVKPENILLDHLGVIKFVDFGAAKVIAKRGRTRQSYGTAGTASITGGGESKLNSMTGTPMYMSPEVITGANQGQQSSIDMWSMGCCVLEMATGRRPWANLDNEWAIMYHIAAGHLPQFPSPDQISELGLAFLTRTLQRDPLSRPTAVDLLEDPWIVSIRLSTLGPLENGHSLSPSIETPELRPN